LASTRTAGPTAQRLIALGTIGLACLAIALSAFCAEAGTPNLGGLLTLLLAIGLAFAIVQAYRFPLMLGSKATMTVTGIPIYLTVVLLPPALAGAAVGLGTLGGELVGCRICNNPLRHIVTHAARLGLVAVLASSVAHLGLGHSPLLSAVTLVGAGATLWLGDFLTILLVLAPLTGRPPHMLFMTLVRTAGAQEAMQYVMGLLGTLAVLQQIWVMPLLLFPTGLVFRALKSAYEKQQDTRQFLEGMADTVDLRDPYTGGHSRRVAELSKGLLREMSKHGAEAALIVSMARIHDIGKVAVTDHILNKPGRLTDEERSVMETHSDRGADLLSRYRDFAAGVAIVRHHHESWDGTGYPHRLAGTNIPFGSRVIAVADSYDAMTTDRPYRAGMPPRRAASILRDGRGIQWDASVVDAFLRTIAGRLEGPLELPLERVSPPAEKSRETA